MHRRPWLLIVIAATASVAGCGTSGKTSASSTTVSSQTTAPASSSATTPATTPASTLATTPPTPPTGGQTVTVTNQSGYKYQLSATTITSATSATGYQGSTFDATPGQEYFVTTVTVRSAVTDRPEPDIAFTDNGAGPFVIAVPDSAKSSFGSNDFCDTTSTNPCYLSGMSALGQENPSPSDPINPQIQPGGSTQVVVYCGPVSTVIPASEATVYFDGGATPIQIPTS